MAATAKSALSDKQTSLVDAFTSYGRDEQKELLRQAEDLLCFSDRKIIKNEVRTQRMLNRCKRESERCLSERKRECVSMCVCV
jgi:predicted metalloprotease